MANLSDSYSETNVSNYQNVRLSGTNRSRYSHSFAGNGENTDSAKFYLKKYGSPTGNCYAKIYAHTGTYGTSSVPTGSALATSNAFDVSTLTTTAGLKTFTFATPYTLANGTNYCLVFDFQGGDDNNMALVGYDSTSPTHGGNVAYWDGSTWTAISGTDAIFYVYTVPASTTTSSDRLTYSIGKDTNSSARGVYMSGQVGSSYTMENSATLGTDDAVLGTSFTAGNYTSVATDDDSFLGLGGVLTYNKFLFKQYNSHGNSTDSIIVTWTGKTTRLSSGKTVYLQIYNRNSSAWETLASDNSTAINTKFTLTGTQSTNLAYYYDANCVVNIRVYQDIT